MRKAVSEIVVMIMILLIVATLAGVAIFFMTGLAGQTTSEVGQSNAQSLKKMGSCLQIVSFDASSNNILVKNCGRYTIENVTVFIDSKPAGSVSINAMTNEIKNITISASLGIHEIRLLGDYASAAISVNVANAGPVCLDGTSYGQCSAAKPLYCSSGTLVNKCSVCGCSGGGTCQADESCFIWFDPAWDYRKNVSITGSATALTNYQVLITADTASLISASKMRSDCGDIRFTDSDKVTQLNYWIESGCESASTKVWVNASSIPTSGTTIYMYYGSPSAASASSGASTFIGFGGLNSFIENDPASRIVKNNDSTVSILAGLAGKNAYLYKNIISPSDFIFEFESQVDSDSSPSGNFPFSIGISNDGTRYSNQATGYGLYALYHINNKWYIVQNNAGAITPSSSVAITLGTAYYFRISRIGTTATLGIYTDKARTTHISGSPTSITSLTTSITALQVLTAWLPTETATASGFVQNIRVRKYASPEPSATAGTEEAK